MLTKQESLFVSFARVVAMILIVVCHVLQAYGNNWAYVFNVGVQIFFLLSGFLYGRKDKIEARQFFVSRLIKVYLPYVLYMAIVVVVMVFVLGKSVAWKQIVVYAINMQGFIGEPIEGLNHLWFLSVLMVGYVLTPMLKDSLKRNRLLTIACLIGIALVEYLWLQKRYALFTWIALYLVGIVVGSVNFKVSKWIGVVSIPATLVFVFMLPDVSALTQHEYAFASVWLHVFLAFSMLTILYLTSRMLKDSLPMWMKWLDSYSYEIYLTHHLYVLGPCSLLFFSDYKIIGVVFAIVATLVSAIVLKQLSKISDR